MGKIAGNATTELEEDQEYVKLPTSNNKPYLLPKAETALKFPKITIKIEPTGAQKLILLRQIVMSGLIRADEARFDYKWYYKAEVNFDMPLTAREVPKPFLSQTSRDPDRRYHLTPFPQGRRKGCLRRPDLIIVKDRNCHWPGRATTDHQGNPHPDNLHRVVEIKFPKDDLPEQQRDAYLQIAGGRDRFTLLHVIERKERERQTQSSGKTAPRPGQEDDRLPLPTPVEVDGIPRGEDRRIPVYGQKLLPEPAFHEIWLEDTKEFITSLSDGIFAARDQLSEKTQALLREHVPWLFEAGQWVEDKAAQAWHFVDEQGRKICTWTTAQLKAEWIKIQRRTDLELEDLSRVEWSQVLMDLGEGLLTVVLVIAGAAVVVVLAVVLVKVLLALIAIAVAALSAGAAALAAFLTLFAVSAAAA
jgi:hypothetical protein